MRGEKSNVLERQGTSGGGVGSKALIDSVGGELVKMFSGFRGELSINQILAGEGPNGAMLIFEDVQWMDTRSLQVNI